MDIGNQASDMRKLGRKDYEKRLAELQIELTKLQEWIKQKGLKVVVIFEGRDAAGKGGVIKRITESLSPRICRVVALATPTTNLGALQQPWMQQRIQHRHCRTRSASGSHERRIQDRLDRHQRLLWSRPCSNYLCRWPRCRQGAAQGGLGAAVAEFGECLVWGMTVTISRAVGQMSALAPMAAIFGAA